jgi:hypothetical protein
MENLKLQYRNLETKVFRILRDMVEKSSHVSVYTKTNAFKVNVFDYQELTIVNGKLTFIDRNGYQHSLFSEATLEDLIDIINARY